MKTLRSIFPMSSWFSFVSILCLISACQEREETFRPVRGSVSQSVYASGTIKSKNQYEVYARVNGIIEQVYVEEGDIVIKGQPILFISNQVQRLNKENALLAANFNEMSANTNKIREARVFSELAREKMENDSLLYSRQSGLWKQGIGTQAELEQRGLAYKNAKSSYVSSLLRLEDLERQLRFMASQAEKNLMISQTSENDYTVRSELDGRVYSLNKVKGEMVSPQTPLAVVGEAGNFILEMQVDEYDIAKIKAGMPVVVSLDSYRDQVFEANVTRVFPLMNERNKSFIVRAGFTKAPPILYPNTSLEANIVIAEKKNTLLIPRSYLLNDSTVIKGKGEKVRVRTGLKDHKYIEILGGISENDELLKPDQ